MTCSYLVTHSSAVPTLGKTPNLSSASSASVGAKSPVVGEGTVNIVVGATDLTLAPESLVLLSGLGGSRSVEVVAGVLTAGILPGRSVRGATGNLGHGHNANTPHSCSQHGVRSGFLPYSRRAPPTRSVRLSSRPSFLVSTRPLGGRSWVPHLEDEPDPHKEERDDAQPSGNRSLPHE